MSDDGKRPRVEGELTWTGEHWINYLREPGQESDSGRVSLFSFRWCPAGAGTAALVDVPGRFTGLCTDNREVLEYARATMTRSWPEEEIPVVDAEFSESGDLRTDPAWRIDTGSHVILAAWGEVEAPVVCNGPWPDSPSGDYVFSLLHFCGRAALEIDGEPVAGAPYTRDIWRSTIGGDRSSCVFALAESFVRRPS